MFLFRLICPAPMSSVPLLSRCGSLLPAVQHVLAHDLTALDESEPMMLLWHMHSFWLHMMRAIWASSGGGGSVRPVSLRALEKDCSGAALDRRVIASFGESAGVDAPVPTKTSKSVCGPLLTPLLAEVEAAMRRRKASDALPIDLVHALSAARMQEWMQRWLSALLQSHLVQKHIEERTGFVLSTSSALFAAWEQHLQADGGAAAVKPSSLVSDLTAFKELVPSTGPVWLLIYEAINRPARQSTSRAGSANVIMAQQQMGLKHRAATAKIEMAVAALAQQDGHKSNGVKQRTCKYADCADRAIPADAKFASLRCTAGCVLSMHHHCFPVYSAENEEPDAAAAEQEDPVLPCPGRDCEGALHKVLLRQSGKTLAVLLEPPASPEEPQAANGDGDAPTASVAPASSSSSGSGAGQDDDDDDEDDEEEDAASSAADLLDPALRDAPSKRQLRQLRCFNIAIDNDRRHVSKRFEVNEAGQLVFSSTQNRIERLKAKKARLANAEEARKRKEAEEAKRIERQQQEAAASSASSAPSTATAAGSKPFTFEVVVKKTGTSPTIAPRAAPSSWSPLTTPALGPAAASAAVPAGLASKKQNIFSALNLDDDEADDAAGRPKSVNGVPTYLTRNAWDDGFHPHVAPAWSTQQQRLRSTVREHDPEVVPRDRVADIPITVKPAKKGRGIGGKLARSTAANEEEDEQLKMALAFSLSETAPTKPQASSKAGSAAAAVAVPAAAAVAAASAQHSSPAHAPSPAPGGPAISNAAARTSPAKLVRAEGEPGSDEGHGEEAAAVRSATPPSAQAAAVAAASPSPVPAAKPMAVRMASAPAPAKALMMAKPAVTPSPFAMRPVGQVAQQQQQPPAQPYLMQQPLAVAQPLLSHPMFAAPVPVAAAPRAVPMSQPPAAVLQSPLLRTFPPASAPISAPVPVVPAPVPMPVSIRAPAPVAPPPFTPPPGGPAPAQQPLQPSAPAYSAAPSLQPAAAASLPVAAPSPMVPSPATVPVSPAPLAAPAPAVPSGGLQLCESIAESSVPTAVLLLPSVPASVGVPLIGGEFCVFGRLSVKLLLTVRTGLTAVLLFQSVEAASAARDAMRGRQYVVEAPGRFPTTWTVDIAFAETPVRVVPMPQVAVRSLVQ